jgi:MarR family transcriptional regulator, organic hydroperoxide resistance regulator
MAAAAWLTKDGHDATQIMISSMTRLDPNTISQILRVLEKKKLIQRTTSADPRAKNVALTDQGSRVLSHALPAVEQADAAYFSPLNYEELQQLVSIFQKLACLSSK